MVGRSEVYKSYVADSHVLAPLRVQLDWHDFVVRVDEEDLVILTYLSVVVDLFEEDQISLARRASPGDVCFLRVEEDVRCPETGLHAHGFELEAALFAGDHFGDGFCADISMAQLSAVVQSP